MFQPHVVALLLLAALFSRTQGMQIVDFPMGGGDRDTGIWDDDDAGLGGDGDWLGGMMDDLPEIDFDQTYIPEVEATNATAEGRVTKTTTRGSMRMKQRPNGFPMRPLEEGKVAAMEVSAITPLSCGSRVDLYGGDIYWLQTPSYPILTNNPADR